MRTAIALYFFFASQAIALDCKPLEPSADDTVSREFQGRVEGEVSGLMSRLGGVNAEIDGAYKEIIRAPDLSTLSRGEQLYIWEKLIFLKCELLSESRLSDAEKSSEFDSLLDKMIIGPAQEEAKLECKFPKNPLADLYPGNEEVPSPLAGFSRVGSQPECNLECLVQRGQYGMAIAIAANSFRSSSKQFGEYSQKTYYQADRFSFVLRSLLSSDGKNVQYVQGFSPQEELNELMKRYGAEIGKFNCISSAGPA